jgi:hypothetical protein
MVFTVFSCILLSKITFLLTYMKSLTNSENHSSNPLQETCSDFPIATYDLVILKIFSKAGHECTYIEEKQPMRNKESRIRYLRLLTDNL